MISAQEASRGLFGAWRLARFDADGIEFFDNTPEAAVASFKAALLVLPVQLALILVQTDWSQVAGGLFGLLLIHLIAFVADWAAFPLAMYYVARMAGREAFYCRYVGAYNWARVLQVIAYLGISVIANIGLLPRGLGEFLVIAVLIAIFVYKGFIARAGLELSPSGTVGVVLLDLAVSALLSAVMISLLRGHGLLG